MDDIAGSWAYTFFAVGITILSHRIFSMIGHQTLTQNDVQTLFAMHKLRFTRQRMAVYQALVITENHPTADELYHQVSYCDHSISLATVYNTLETLCGCNLAQKLATDSSSARYDATTHNHLHIRDPHSGRVKDVPDELGKQLLDQLPHGVLRKIESQLGYKISEVKIELIGEQA
jgi:Fe2+ or Zn2+ uptake regulation protein